MKSLEKLGQSFGGLADKPSPWLDNQGEFMACAKTKLQHQLLPQEPTSHPQGCSLSLMHLNPTLPNNLGN
jgi:hypothetical protein